jgi:hypothetical protein
MGNPVGWPVLQHKQQPTGVALVTTELVAQPLDGRDDLVRVSLVGARPTARSRIGLATSPGTAVEPTCSTATARSRARNPTQPRLARTLLAIRAAVDQADLPVGQPEHGVIEAVHTTSVRGRYARGYQPGRQAGLEVVEKSLTGPYGGCRVEAQSRTFAAQVGRCETAADLYVCYPCRPLLPLRFR